MNVVSNDVVSNEWSQMNQWCVQGEVSEPPPLGVTRVNISYFWLKHYYSLIQCATKQIISRYSAFKGPRFRNCSAQVLCFLRGPQEQLQFEGNLLSKGPPTATEMCTYSSFKLY